jgi:hypothetical protein
MMFNSMLGSVPYVYSTRVRAGLPHLFVVCSETAAAFVRKIEGTCRRCMYVLRHYSVHVLRSSNTPRFLWKYSIRTTEVHSGT